MALAELLFICNAAQITELLLSFNILKVEFRIMVYHPECEVTMGWKMWM